MRVQKFNEHKASFACGRCLGRRDSRCGSDERTRKRTSNADADYKRESNALALAHAIASPESNRYVYADTTAHCGNAEADADIHAVSTAADDGALSLARVLIAQPFTVLHELS